MIPGDDLLAMVRDTAAEHGLTLAGAETQSYLRCAFSLKDGAFGTDTNDTSGNLTECWFLTAEDYAKRTGRTLTLAENEAAVYAEPDNIGAMTDHFTVGGRRFDCAVGLNEYPLSMAAYSTVDCVGLVVADEAALRYIYDVQKAAYQENASEMFSELVLDFADEDAAEAVWPEFMDGLRGRITQYVSENGTDDAYGMSINTRWGARSDYYGLYGTLLFLGLLLSVVFLFATALIIYYKQISEGYEDRGRFQILQKVGMSAGEVRAAIRSQILLVFFLPLAAAAMHVAFAFPMMTRVLTVAFRTDEALFMGCTIAALAAFTLLYALIYRITARVYYRIVK